MQCGRPGFNPWVRKISWRRKWQPTPVFLPGKSHGCSSLVGYSPWARKESDTTELLHFLSFLLSFFPLPFLNPAWTSGSSWFTYYWSLVWRTLSITLLTCEMSSLNIHGSTNPGLFSIVNAKSSEVCCICGCRPLDTEEAWTQRCDFKLGADFWLS